MAPSHHLRVIFGKFDRHDPALVRSTLLNVIVFIFPNELVIIVAFPLLKNTLSDAGVKRLLVLGESNTVTPVIGVVTAYEAPFPFG